MVPYQLPTKKISHLKRLRYLNAPFLNEVTSEGFLVLDQLLNLEHIDLIGNNISSEVIDKLSKLPYLKQLLKI